MSADKPGGLPAGLTLDSQTGLLAGTPTTLGPFAFQITALDASGCFVSAEYASTVQVGTPVVAVPLLSSWTLLLLLGGVLALGMIAIRR